MAVILLVINMMIMFMMKRDGYFYFLISCLSGMYGLSIVLLCGFAYFFFYARISTENVVANYLDGRHFFNCDTFEFIVFLTYIS